MNKSGQKIHKGGHSCKGFKGEKKGLPCLNNEGVIKNQDATLEENEESFGAIGYVSSLGEAPSIQLKCKHIFHVECIHDKLKNKWSGPRITFGFKNCPTCNIEISADHHPEIKKLVKNIQKIESEVRKLSIRKAKEENIFKSEEVKFDENSQESIHEAMRILSFYKCFDCNKIFYAGLVECENVDENEGYDPKEVQCQDGSAKKLQGQTQCKLHKTEFIEYKCHFGCSLATFKCRGGKIHYCTPCHKKGLKKCKPVICPGPQKCSLEVPHPNGGKEYALGCGLCRYSE